MAKLEIPVRVYVDEIEGLIEEIKHLQTYKLFDSDEMILVDRDDVADIFAKHLKAINADAQPEQKHGRWIPFEWNNDWTKRIQLPEGSESVWEEYWEEEFICSACGHVHYRRSFCPHCGARMDKGDES